MTARTEAPTPKRIREARRRGEVGASPEATAAAGLLAGLAALAATGPALAADLAALLRAACERAPALAATAPSDGPAALATALAASLGPAGRAVLVGVLPAGLAACGGAVLCGALQSGFLWAPGAALPRLERLGLLRGLRRLASPAALAAAALGLAKAAVLVAIAVAWAEGEAGAAAISGLARLDAAAAWHVLPVLAGLALRLALAFAALSAFDLLLARRRHLAALRMTRDEVRREHREDEGDPAHKAERRRRHRALADAPPVSRATVVVVNPTHLAVALRHDRAAGGAPQVLAKGAGPAAARLRSAARRAGVPIVRDVPLARALHRLAEVGDEIPEELYAAAAAVLAHLYGLEEKTP